MWLSDGELLGRTVIAADGQAVGTVSALLLDTDSWNVGALKVKLRKEMAERLGAARTLFGTGSIELATTTVRSVGDAVLLANDVEGIRRYLAGEGAPAGP